MRARTSSSRISAPPPGIESRPASRSRAIVSRSESPETSAIQDFRRRKAVQVHLRKSLLDRTQHVFVKLDSQIRMQAALQQHASAANLDHFFDLFVDRFERQNVAVFRAQRPIKRAERAIFGAEIRVVDVAVDLVGGHARIGFLAAHFVRRHSDADQVVGIEKFERFFWCDSHRRLCSSAST